MYRYHVFASHEEAYGQKLSKELIIKFLKDIPLKYQMSYLYEQSLAISLNGYPNEKRILFSHQTLFNYWKWLFAYLHPPNTKVILDKKIIQSNMNYVTLALNDYLDTDVSEDKAYPYLFSNLLFNNHPNTLTNLIRTNYIYTVLARDKSLYNAKDFLDINEEFKNTYGFTINEYLSILFVIMSGFMKKTNDEVGFFKNIYRFFSTTKYEQHAIQVVKDLSMSFDEASKWSRDNIEGYWNISNFKSTPIILMENGDFIPINYSLLELQFFEGLYYKLNYVFKDNPDQFKTFYGLPFEIYCRNVVENSISRSKLPYQLLEKFQYKYQKNTKDSPDLMIKMGQDMLVIEVKSYHVKFRAEVLSDPNTIEKDLEKMVIDPQQQVTERILELNEIDHSSIKDIKNFYFLTITQDGFPTLDEYEEIVKNELQKIPFHGTVMRAHLDIEEYEMLCSLFERKRPIFKVLDKFKGFNGSFKNFLFENKYNVKRSEFFEILYKETIEEWGKHAIDDFVYKFSKRLND